MGEEGFGFDFEEGNVELEHGYAFFDNLTFLHKKLQDLRKWNKRLSKFTRARHITRTRHFMIRKLKKKITKSTAVVQNVMGILDYDFDEIYPDAIFVDNVDYRERYVHWRQLLEDPTRPWAMLQP